MPPKQQPNKAEQAARAKKLEDKTFGLKNKNKSKAVQKYIAEITHSTSGAVRSPPTAFAGRYVISGADLPRALNLCARPLRTSVDLFPCFRKGRKSPFKLQR
jgi:hypothetical protein